MIAAIINIFIGLGLIFVPTLVQTTPPISHHFHIVAPLVITFALISCWEVNHSTRYLNVLCGIWLCIAPQFLSFDNKIALFCSLTGGLAIIVFSLLPRKISGRYGGGWISLFQKNPTHAKM